MADRSWQRVPGPRLSAVHPKHDLRTRHPEVAGPSPAPATGKPREVGLFRLLLGDHPPFFAQLWPLATAGGNAVEAIAAKLSLRRRSG
jgi:hypothetical protein